MFERAFSCRHRCALLRTRIYASTLCRFHLTCFFFNIYPHNTSTSNLARSRKKKWHHRIEYCFKKKNLRRERAFESDRKRRNEKLIQFILIMRTKHFFLLFPIFFYQTPNQNILNGRITLLAHIHCKQKQTNE